MRSRLMEQFVKCGGALDRSTDLWTGETVDLREGGEGGNSTDQWVTRVFLLGMMGTCHLTF